MEELSNLSAWTNNYLEVMASDDFYIWHAFFCLSRFHNNINKKTFIKTIYITQRNKWKYYAIVQESAWKDLEYAFCGTHFLMKVWVRIVVSMMLANGQHPRRYWNRRVIFLRKIHIKDTYLCRRNLSRIHYGDNASWNTNPYNKRSLLSFIKSRDITSSKCT